MTTADTNGTYYDTVFRLVIHSHEEGDVRVITVGVHLNVMSIVPVVVEEGL
jgi:hypothetical protein